MKIIKQLNGAGPPEYQASIRDLNLWKNLAQKGNRKKADFVFVCSISHMLYDLLRIISALAVC